MPANTVFHTNTFYGASNIDDGGTVIVEQDAFIVTGNGDNALDFGNGPQTIKVDGYVESQLNGMYFVDPTGIIANSKLTVGTEGAIIGAGIYSGIHAMQALDVVNSGLIMGGANGIWLENINHSSSKTISITNNAGGEIRGTDHGIYLNDKNHDLILKNAGIIDEIVWGRGSTITNSGTIEDLYQLGSGSLFGNTITNSGTINQDVNLSQVNDVINNSGEIHGELLLYDGNNTVTNSGEIGKTLSAGSGNDTLTNSGTFGGYVHLGDGTNKVTNSGSIGDELTLGSGNDTVGNTGFIGGKIDFFGGTNTLTNGGKVSGNVTFDNGDFKIANTGEMPGVVYLNSGTGTVTNSGTIGSFELFFGTITLTNSGVINSPLLLPNVSGTVSNTKTINGGIEGGGFDGVSGKTFAVTNSGTIGGDVLTHSDALKVTNSGTINGDIIGAANNDTVANTKLIIGDVTLGDGVNKVTNSGTIDGKLATGSGDDVVTSTGTVGLGDNGGDISLGAGNDKFTGGNFTDLLTDGAGNDTYNLGGGNDHIHWVADGNDIVDGGAGIDQFSAEGVSEGVQINLDTKAVGFLAYHLAASSAVTSTSTTTVKGFEFIWGSKYGDALAGTSGDDTLLGLDGADALYGGKGADELNGGAADGVTDGIIYLAITDSGNTKATRDTIRGFEGAGVSGGDKIILSDIDADTKSIGNQAFHLMGQGDVAFDLTPGCLRWVHESGTTAMTIIQGDVNGDGKADFSIAVVGTLKFIESDFSL